MLSAPLLPMTAYRQFITYRLLPDPKKPGKLTKIPCNALGIGCSVTDPQHWTDYSTALAAAPLADVGHGSGVGFVFTEADPFWFLDIDGALTNGQWSATATELYGTLQGAAWEVSQSGTGLHAFGTGAVPPHGTRNTPLGLEFYHRDRFVALTNQTYPGGSASWDGSAPISMLIPRLFPPAVANGTALDGWTDGPVAEWSGPTDDTELLRLARAARTAASMFGGVTFADLYDGNASAWEGRYGASEADAALAAHLAFWTGKDCARIERLMRQSGLARDKWDRASGYLEPTILRACGAVKNVLTAPEKKHALLPPEGLTDPSTLGPFISPAAMAAYFTGCTYIVAHDEIHTPEGVRLNRSQFDTVYGGKRFILDAVGEKSTASAWEAFRLNQAWRCPIADVTCFRPEVAPGTLIADEGRTLLNTYVPVATARLSGDAAPFHDLLARMLPVERDRQILLSYMAALVQNPGRKFQWWPVLQGVEGNGKSAIGRVLAHAVGHRYTHLVNPEAMAKTGNQFNLWVEGNLLVVIEEIYVNNRRDFLESFKATVTNDRIALEGKGTNQLTGDNRINGVMFTNHQDGVPVTDESRRYSIFWTAQQTRDDLTATGMAGDYFPDLYDWLTGRGKHAYLGPNGGYAICNDYLRSYVPQAEFNPAGLCQRAPETSSTYSARNASLGRAEQEVMEAIEEGRVGFAGGFVSSHYLDELLGALRLPIPRNKLRSLMSTIGYDYHPVLIDHGGRVHNPVAPDRRKPRLYIKRGHLLCNLRTGTEVAAAYSRAQLDSGALAALAA